MDDLRNLIRRTAAEVVSQGGVSRHGIVSAVDASGPVVRVTYDEGDPANGVPPTQSGWLPIVQMGMGAGWSATCIPTPGTQVFVAPDMGDPAHGVVLGAVHTSDAPAGQVTPYGASQAGPITPGEVVLQHRSGVSLRLTNGAVEIHGNLLVDGDIKARGQITDLNGAHGSLDVLREDYNQHDHDRSVGLTTKPTP